MLIVGIIIGVIATLIMLAMCQAAAKGDGRE